MEESTRFAPLVEPMRIRLVRAASITAQLLRRLATMLNPRRYRTGCEGCSVRTPWLGSRDAVNGWCTSHGWHHDKYEGDWWCCTCTNLRDAA